MNYEHNIYEFGFVAGDQSQTEIEKKIREMEKMEERLVVFSVDVLDYHSILVALKGCSALFCCLDSSDGYDVSVFIYCSFFKWYDVP